MINKIQDAIVNASGDFERRLVEKWTAYDASIASVSHLIETERRIEEEIIIL